MVKFEQTVELNLNYDTIRIVIVTESGWTVNCMCINTKIQGVRFPNEKHLQSMKNYVEGKRFKNFLRKQTLNFIQNGFKKGTSAMNRIQRFIDTPKPNLERVEFLKNNIDSLTNTKEYDNLEKSYKFESVDIDDDAESGEQVQS